MSWYSGKKTMANANEPGIAATVYFVQRLRKLAEESAYQHKRRMSTDHGTDLEISAALSSTVTSVAIYAVVPQTHWPAVHPCGSIRSSQ